MSAHFFAIRPKTHRPTAATELDRTPLGQTIGLAPRPTPWLPASLRKLRALRVNLFQPIDRPPAKPGNRMKSAIVMEDLSIGGVIDCSSGQSEPD